MARAVVHTAPKPRKKPRVKHILPRETPREAEPKPDLDPLEPWRQKLAKLDKSIVTEDGNWKAEWETDSETVSVSVSDETVSRSYNIKVTLSGVAAEDGYDSDEDMAADITIPGGPIFRIVDRHKTWKSHTEVMAHKQADGTYEIDIDLTLDDKVDLSGLLPIPEEIMQGRGVPYDELALRELVSLARKADSIRTWQLLGILRGEFEGL